MKTNLAYNSPTASRLLLGTAAKITPAPSRLLVRICLLLGLITVSSVAARASDPVGVYAIVDKVVLQPSPSAPELIQIIGTFSLAKPGRGGDAYTAPQHGYLYYKLNPAKKEICENEWADLKEMAGTGQCVAFGGRYQDKGHVRELEEKLGKPDVYPVAQGITKVKESAYAPVKKLYEMASAHAEWHGKRKEHPKADSKATANPSR